MADSLTREQRAMLEGMGRSAAEMLGKRPQPSLKVARGYIAEAGDHTYDVLMPDGAVLEEVPCLISALGGSVGDEVRVEWVQGRALVTGVVATDGQQGLGGIWPAHDKYQTVSVGKFGDYSISGHKFQGMACDGSKLYLASHTGDSAPTTITAVDLSDGSVASRAEIALTGHFNSMCYLGGWLYAACAGAAGDYGSMAAIKVSDMSYDTYELPYDLWAVAVHDPGTGAYLAGLVADSHEWVVYSRENPDSWTMTPVSRFTGYDGSGIIQGCDADDDYLYQVFSKDPAGWESESVIAVMEWSGYVRRVLGVYGCGDVELEDVCVPDGHDGAVYVNDIHGGVWVGQLGDLLKPEYTTWVRSPWMGQPVQNIYQSYNGTETFAGSSPRVVSSFKAMPYMYDSTVSSIVGDVQIGGEKFPVTYNGNNGSLSCNGVYLKGYTPVYFHLYWTRSSDDRQYGWNLDDESWVCDASAKKTHYGASGIASSGLVSGDTYVNKLVAVCGVKPYGSIEM